MLNNMTNKIQMLYKKFESWFEKEWGWFLTNGCQVHNVNCCGGGSVINKHVSYWDALVS